MTAPLPPPGASSRRSSPVSRLLDLVGSIWFGVVLLVLIFIYSSIGSAAPPIRQGAMADWTGLEFLRFDKSEMEWFSWWPFTLMVGLFCLSLVTVTVRRIPLTIVNAGVWMIHTGIIILAVSSVIYFGRKVEGTTPIFQSVAKILAPGMSEPQSLVVRPEASTVVGAGDRVYRISVAQIMPNYEILDEKNRGKKTQQIWFNVEPLGGQSFIRTMLVGYPEYTEDVIQGANGPQRAKNINNGDPLLDKELQIALDYDVARYFYHAHAPPVRATGAIYARFSPEEPWVQLRYTGLPHYYEHIAHMNDLWPVSGVRPKVQASLDLRPEEFVEAGEPASAAAVRQLDIRITDYLPYASLEQRWVAGHEHDPLNPYVSVRLGTRGGGSETRELLAADPQKRRARLADFLDAEFVWAESAERREVLARKPEPRFVVKVAEQGVEKTFRLDELLGKGAISVEGTDYTLELDTLIPGGDMLPGIDQIAAFEIVRGETRITRYVVAGENGRSLDLDENRRPTPELRDTGIQITFLEPSPQRLLLIGGPESASVLGVLTTSNGQYQRFELPAGQTVDVAPMVQLTVETVLARARSEVRPAIVPRSQRQSMQSVGKVASLVRVEIDDGKAITSTWLPFTQYAFESNQWAQPGRFGWIPRQVRLADGRSLSLMYAPWRDPLPQPIALDRFVLETHTGGDRPADYISYVRFQQADGEWGPLVTVKSNNPAQSGDLWFFQAQWDPGVEAHTVLGVGNRHGVHAMLFGTCVSIAGMIYAFYFKPVIIRRRKQAALAAAEARGVRPGAGSRDVRADAEAEVSHV
jgi:hypothetical protein